MDGDKPICTAVECFCGKHFKTDPQATCGCPGSNEHPCEVHKHWGGYCHCFDKSDPAATATTERTSETKAREIAKEICGYVDPNGGVNLDGLEKFINAALEAERPICKSCSATQSPGGWFCKWCLEAERKAGREEALSDEIRTGAQLMALESEAMRKAKFEEFVDGIEKKARQAALENFKKVCTCEGWEKL